MCDEVLFEDRNDVHTVLDYTKITLFDCSIQYKSLEDFDFCHVLSQTLNQPSTTYRLNTPTTQDKICNQK